MTLPDGRKDPVSVSPVWVANCDDCGWHCPASEPESAVREWARLHRLSCPLKATHPRSAHA
jgi:hypothetical protein